MFRVSLFNHKGKPLSYCGEMGPEIGMKEDLMLKDLKGALSGLRQFLVNENPLKIVKNAIYFTLKALFVFKIFTLFILTVRSCIKTA